MEVALRPCLVHVFGLTARAVDIDVGLQWSLRGHGLRPNSTCNPDGTALGFEDNIPVLGNKSHRAGPNSVAASHCTRRHSVHVTVRRAQDHKAIRSSIRSRSSGRLAQRITSPLRTRPTHLDISTPMAELDTEFLQLLQYPALALDLVLPLLDLRLLL